MGFLDKLQQTAKDTLDKGKEKLEDVQADRSADKMLRDLGAWYYAGRTGRDNGEGAANIERIIAELQAHEAEHGPLGGEHKHDDPAAAAAAPAPGTPPAPTDAAPTPPPPPSAPGGPVTSGPPPPPPSV
jgi:hypothetical protein